MIAFPFGNNNFSCGLDESPVGATESTSINPDPSNARLLIVNALAVIFDKSNVFKLVAFKKVPVPIEGSINYL